MNRCGLFAGSAEAYDKNRIGCAGIALEYGHITDCNTRNGIIVENSSYALTTSDNCINRIAQINEHRFIGFINDVAINRDGNCLACHSGRKNESARSWLVIAAGGGGAVGSCVID